MQLVTNIYFLRKKEIVSTTLNLTSTHFFSSNISFSHNLGHFRKNAKISMTQFFSAEKLMHTSNTLLVPQTV